MLTDRPIIAGPGQLDNMQLVAPVYRAALAAANAQLDLLPQLREQGRITEMAYHIADEHLTAQVALFSLLLTECGEPQPQPIR